MHSILSFYGLLLSSFIVAGKTKCSFSYPITSTFVVVTPPKKTTFVPRSMYVNWNNLPLHHPIVKKRKNSKILFESIDQSSINPSTDMKMVETTTIDPTVQQQPLPLPEQPTTVSTTTFSTTTTTTPSVRPKRIRRKDTIIVDDSVRFDESDPEEQMKEIENEVQTEDYNVMTLKPRKESKVILQVPDVRELTGLTVDSTGTLGTNQEMETFSVSGIMSSLQSSFNKSTKSLPTPSTTSTTIGESSFPLSSSNDSLERMLVDAKEMEIMDKNNKNKNNASMNDDNDDSIGNKIRNVISTIVTIDFFVVCGFLAWFLTGIFASYVLKDDTIQIAFNSNFQALVQPALGILMIAAITDAFSKDENDS